MSSNSVQGQTPGRFGGLAVVNDQLLPVVIGFPWLSVPVRVAVYFTKPLSGLSGVKVIARVEVSYDVVPGTMSPRASFRVSPSVPATTALEYLALTVVVEGTLEESGSGHLFIAMSGESSVAENVRSTK